jgi:hypothetical protein
MMLFGRSGFLRLQGRLGIFMRCAGASLADGGGRLLGCGHWLSVLLVTLIVRVLSHAGRLADLVRVAFLGFPCVPLGKRLFACLLACLGVLRFV